MWRVNLTELAKVDCPFRGCDKSFRKPSQLKQHQRVHTGEVGTAICRAFAVLLIVINSQLRMVVSLSCNLPGNLPGAAAPGIILPWASRFQYITRTLP